MPAPRITFEPERPQLPTINAPSGLPFLGGSSSGGDSGRGSGGLGAATTGSGDEES